MPSGQNSVIYIHFNFLSATPTGSEVECKLCSAKLSYNKKATSNLINHLKVSFNIFQTYLKQTRI